MHTYLCTRLQNLVCYLLIREKILACSNILVIDTNLQNDFLLFIILRSDYDSHYSRR